jgi:hypothetical protein
MGMLRTTFMRFRSAYKHLGRKPKRERPRETCADVTILLRQILKTLSGIVWTGFA